MIPHHYTHEPLTAVPSNRKQSKTIAVPGDELMADLESKGQEAYNDARRCAHHEHDEKQLGLLGQARKRAAQLTTKSRVRRYPKPTFFSKMRNRRRGFKISGAECGFHA